MRKEIAVEVSRLAAEASGVLDHSVAVVNQLCSEKAAGVYRSSIGRAMGEVAFAFLFPIWREHPDLEPDEMKGPSGYDPRDFKMPAAAVQAALDALAAAHALMNEVRAKLEDEPSVQEREVYLNGLASVLRKMADAVDGVEQRRA